MYYIKADLYRETEYMPRKNSSTKPVHSFRLSFESLRQLKDLSGGMGRSQADIVEVAIDRMYREEIRYGNRMISERQQPEDNLLFPG
jgi:predicted DNA-binding protein